MFIAKVLIKRRKSILDPQGKAVEQGAKLLGFHNIKDVRIDKQIAFSVFVDDFETANKEVNEFCKKLLSNPTMEDYEFELVKSDEN